MGDQWKEVQPDGSMTGSVANLEIPETEAEEFSYENEKQIVRVYVELEDSQDGLSLEARLQELQATVPFEIHRIFEKDNSATLNLESAQVKRLRLTGGVKSVVVMEQAELTYDELDESESTDEYVTEESSTVQESEDIGLSEQSELDSQEQAFDNIGESVGETDKYDSYQSVADQQDNGGTSQNQTGMSVKIGGVFVLGCIVLVGMIVAIRFIRNK